METAIETINRSIETICSRSNNESQAEEMKIKSYGWYDFFIFDKKHNENNYFPELNQNSKINVLDFADKRVLFIEKLLVNDELILTINENGEMLIDTFKHCFRSSYPYLKKQNSVKNRIKLSDCIFDNDKLNLLVETINENFDSFDKNDDLEWFLTMYPKLSTCNKAFYAIETKMKELIEQGCFDRRHA